MISCHNAGLYERNSALRGLGRRREHMSDKRLNNTIFLMFLATENYKRAHVLSNKDFL